MVFGVVTSMIGIFFATYDIEGNLSVYLTNNTKKYKVNSN